MSGTGASPAPTVRDVADLAGVSPMTVSRTMAGGRNVRPEVQERVRSAVEQLGYRPNQNARNTRLRQSTGLVGVAVTNLGNPYYGQFALGAENVARSSGRQILLGNTGEDAAREQQLLADFAGRQVEGLILVPAGNGLARPEAAGLAGVPLVLASRSVEGLSCDTVLVDDIGGARAGTADLLARGHTRIAFLGDVESISTARRRYTGFTRALESAGIDFDPAMLVRCRDAATAAAQVHRLLTGPRPPTAFFSANNRTTVGALRALCQRRSSTDPLPALACFDDVELADLLGVPLTVISHNPEELGAQAARFLFERQSGSATGPPRLAELPVTIRRF